MSGWRRQRIVKVHYKGYSTCYDEWRARDNIVDLQPDDETGSEDDDAVEDTDAGSGIAPILPFNLYCELVVGIKGSLTSSRKKSPQVRIRIPLDKLTFDGGLKPREEAGGGSTPLNTIKIYKISWEGVVL